MPHLLALYTLHQCPQLCISATIHNSTYRVIDYLTNNKLPAQHRTGRYEYVSLYYMTTRTSDPLSTPSTLSTLHVFDPYMVIKALPYSLLSDYSLGKCSISKQYDAGQWTSTAVKISRCKFCLHARTEPSLFFSVSMHRLCQIASNVTYVRGLYIHYLP